jgi:hypothetical protein
MFSKDKPFRSKVYLAWVRRLPCAWCGRPGPSEASHHPAPGRGSIAMKTCDLRTLPLCHADHELFHASGTIGAMTGEQTRAWAEVRITDHLRAYLREKHFREARYV